MKKNKIYAHRGYAEKYPENTLLAFQEAFAHGADGVECDLQKSGDGCYILLHDDTVNRTAKNRTGSVSSLTLAELKMCCLEADQTIPEFLEFLKTLPAGKYLDLELKPETITGSDCPEIHKLLQPYIKKEYLMVSSNAPELLVYFKKQKITTGLILEHKSKEMGFSAVLRMIFRYKPDYLNLPVQIFSELGTPLAWLFIGFMKLLGKKIAFWTINTEKDLIKIYHTSRIIITDRVEFIQSALKSLEKRTG